MGIKDKEKGGGESESQDTREDRETREDKERYKEIPSAERRAYTGGNRPSQE